MGIYYFAVDFSNNEIIDPPGKFADKFPGICHPHNPFCGMVVMMNAKGSFFEIVNDSTFEQYEGKKNVTKDALEEYIRLFPFLKEDLKDMLYNEI